MVPEDHLVPNQVIKAHLERAAFPRNPIHSDHIVTQKPLSYLVSGTISLGYSRQGLARIR